MLRSVAPSFTSPRVLLLDEPVTHLDARLRYEMRAEIKLLHSRIGTTTIHVTHDQQEALAMGDLIAVMQEGRLEQLGAPLEIYENPSNSFVAGFVGDPPMSLVCATLTDDRCGPACRSPTGRCRCRTRLPRRRGALARGKCRSAFVRSRSCLRQMARARCHLGLLS